MRKLSFFLILIFSLSFVSCDKQENEISPVKIYDDWCDWETKVSANKYIVGQAEDSLRVNIRQEGLNPDWVNDYTLTLFLEGESTEFRFQFEKVGESFTYWLNASDFDLDSFENAPVYGTVFVTKTNPYASEGCTKNGDQWNAAATIE